MQCPVSVLQSALADAERAGEENPVSDGLDLHLLGGRGHARAGAGGQGGAASGRAWLLLAFGSELEAVAGECTGTSLSGDTCLVMYHRLEPVFLVQHASACDTLRFAL